MNTEQAANGFSAMGSQSRLELVQLLVRAGETGLSVGDMQSATNMAPSTLAHHLKFLSDAALIVQEKRGRSVISSANFEHLESLATFILANCCSEEVSNYERVAS